MDSRPPANGPEPDLNPHQSISTIQIMSTQSYPTLYADNPNYTKPLYDFKPHQIKLFDNPWIQPISQPMDCKWPENERCDGTKQANKRSI